MSVDLTQLPATLLDWRHSKSTQARDVWNPFEAYFASHGLHLWRIGNAPGTNPTNRAPRTPDGLKYCIPFNEGRLARFDHLVG
jgi:hypothetical protein